MQDVKSPPQIAEETLPSTVLLEMEDSNGQPHGVGSGFFVGNGEIATNFHVVEGAEKGSAKLFNRAERYDIEGYTVLDVDNDLIILKLQDIDQTIVSRIALPLGDSESIRIGDQIYAVGNPEGLEGTISDGIISGIRRLNRGYQRIQITAPISPGSSGGAVLNTNGEVIGVSVSGVSSLLPISSHNPQDAQYINVAQNLNLAIPVSYLESLLQQPWDKIIPLREAKLERVIPIGNFGWIGSASYTFPLLNRSSKTLRNVHCEVSFKDEEGNVFARDTVFFPWLIPANSTKMVIRLSTYDTNRLALGLPENIQLLQNANLIDYDESDVSKSPIESFLLGLADLLLTNMDHTNYSQFEPNIKRLMKDYEIRVIDLEVVD